MAKQKVKAVQPILITGAPRSGTSLIAGIIQLSGAWGGPMTGPHPENPRGFFENLNIKDDIVMPFMVDQGVDLLTLRQLPPNKMKPVRGWAKQIRKIIKQQGYRSGPWFYKDTKMCTYWRVWHRSFPDAKWVIVRRDTENIASSCEAASWMGGISTHNGWLQYANEHITRSFDLIDARGSECFEIWPDKIFKGDYSKVRELIMWLGLKWYPRKVRKFVIPEAWHHTGGVKNA